MLSNIWKAVRRPFRSLNCNKHQWERYDYNLAGCLCCGLQHVCKADLCVCTCPLVTLDDGCVGCTITGFVIPVIRCGKEFTSQVARIETPVELPDYHSCVSRTVHKLLYSATAQSAYRNEIGHKLRIYRAACIRMCKEYKQANPNQPVCVPVLLAQVLHSLRLHPRAPVVTQVIHRCTEILMRCISDLVPHSRNKKQLGSENFIVGVLYLMRQGLVFEGVTWLPKIPSLHLCLPQENTLSKVFKISNKVICETENDIKSMLRHRAGLN